MVQSIMKPDSSSKYKVKLTNLQRAAFRMEVPQPQMEKRFLDQM